MNKIFQILKEYVFLTIAVVVVVVGGATYFVVQMSSQGTNLNDASQQINDTSEKADETGYIYVDGGAGVLSNYSKYGYSYIGESARGTEAYLAEKGATATYEFTSEAAGSYKLEISLSDDAVHDSNTRSATVTMNGGGVVFYKHQSEDTKGWKWYSLGTLSVKKGKNKVTFVKDETTSAAFVMDQFRLVPVN